MGEGRGGVSERVVEGGCLSSANEIHCNYRGIPGACVRRHCHGQWLGRCVGVARLSVGVARTPMSCQWLVHGKHVGQIFRG